MDETGRYVHPYKAQANYGTWSIDFFLDIILFFYCIGPKGEKNIIPSKNVWFISLPIILL